MGIRKILKSIGTYFNLQAAPAAADPGYNFIVESAPAPAANIGQRLVNYFDLHSEYRAGDKLATAIMKLANDEGVAQGHFDSSSMTGRYAYSFTEGDFQVKLEKNGVVLLKADAAFAEKVKTLASVASVKEIGGTQPAAPAAKADGPKQ